MNISFCKKTRCSRLYQQTISPYRYHCCGTNGLDDFDEVRLINKNRCENRRGRPFNQIKNLDSAASCKMVREFINDCYE